MNELGKLLPKNTNNPAIEDAAGITLSNRVAVALISSFAILCFGAGFLGYKSSSSAGPADGPDRAVTLREFQEYKADAQQRQQQIQMSVDSMGSRVEHKLEILDNKIDSLKRGSGR